MIFFLQEEEKSEKCKPAISSAFRHTIFLFEKIWKNEEAKINLKIKY